MTAGTQFLVRLPGGAPLPAPRGFHHVYEFVNYRDSVDAIRDFALPYEVVFEA